MTLPVEYNTLSEHVVWRLLTGYPHSDALPAPPMSAKQLSVISAAGGRSGSGGWWGRGRRLLGRGSVAPARTLANVAIRDNVALGESEQRPLGTMTHYRQ